MNAVRARFDGARVNIPPEISEHQPGEVVEILENEAEYSAISHASQEAAFSKIWDNADDAIYD